jgi:hypothetical protein
VFVVRTDHYALKFMLDQRLSTISQHHWISKLFGYDFRVEFRPGRSNIVADALSRQDGEEPLLSALFGAHAACFSAVSVPTFRLFDDLRREVDADPALRARRDAVAAGDHGDSWCVCKGLLLHKGHVFVPNSSPILDDVLQLAHTGGHEGI